MTKLKTEILFMKEKKYFVFPWDIKIDLVKEFPKTFFLEIPQFLLKNFIVICSSCSEMDFILIKILPANK